MSIRTYAVNCNDAWLNTEGDDISGSYVKYKDHQNVVADLEAKCAALAAELSQAKSVVSECREYFIAGIMNRIRPTNEGYLHMRCDTLGDETPSHDAFLAEVRAQGIDAAIEHLNNKFEGTGHIGVPVMALEWLAAQLRQDANTAELIAAGIINKVGE